MASISACGTLFLRRMSFVCCKSLSYSFLYLTPLTTLPASPNKDIGANDAAISSCCSMDANCLNPSLSIRPVARRTALPAHSSAISPKKPLKPASFKVCAKGECRAYRAIWPKVVLPRALFPAQPSPLPRASMPKSMVFPKDSDQFSTRESAKPSQMPRPTELSSPSSLVWFIMLAMLDRVLSCVPVCHKPWTTGRANSVPTLAAVDIFGIAVTPWATARFSAFSLIRACPIQRAKPFVLAESALPATLASPCDNKNSAMNPNDSAAELPAL